MAQNTVTASDTDVSFPWVGGVAAGLVAGAVMAAMLTAQSTPTIARAIPALYGLSGLAAGWGIHLVHSALFGVAFAGVVNTLGVTSRPKTLAAGVTAGVVVWFLGAALLMPAWLAAVGFPKAPALPNIAPSKLVGHVVWGLVLGAVFPVVRDL